MSQQSLTPAQQEQMMSSRLWRAARAYARAYDQLERKSRSSDGANVELFARFQEAQVELNLAALDLFAGGARNETSGKRARPGARASGRRGRKKP
jgi:hypothetical protein